MLCFMTNLQYIYPISFPTQRASTQEIIIFIYRKNQRVLSVFLFDFACKIRKPNRSITHKLGREMRIFLELLSKIAHIRLFYAKKEYLCGL